MSVIAMVGVALILASLPFEAAAAPNPDFQAAGEALLDQMLLRFKSPAQNGLYAERLDASGVIDPAYNGNSFVWPASHMLRALRWGAKAAPAKYGGTFRDYVFAVYRYKSQTGGRAGYAVLPGSTDLFFDDNAVMMVEMALAYGELRAAPVLDDAKMAYAFCHLARDAEWGIPQKPAQTGNGMFYSMVVSPIGHGAGILHRLDGGSAYRDEAVQYYARMSDPVKGLKDTATGLFHQYAFGAGGSWTLAKTVNGVPLDGRGFRAYQTTYVIRLALELYAATGKAEYLADARAMLTACLGRFHTQGKGLHENGFWGGNDMVDALEDMYEVTGEAAWHAYASDIVAFLITYGRDARGWYPGDEDDTKGDWHLDRRQAGAAPVSMMGQAAAASAILRVAYHTAHPTALRARPGSFRTREWAGSGPRAWNGLGRQVEPVEREAASGGTPSLRWTW